jgi:murein tripeptide amidase MpaA
MNFRRLAGFILLASLGIWFHSGIGQELSPDRMNYHDFAETEAVLQALDAASSYVQLETIGYSYNYRSNPSDPPAYPIYALRVSANTPAASGDRYDRNGILFDCTCHAREWLTSESCLELAQYLVDNRTNAGTVVPELLQHTEVWIIPMVNPAGRSIDDTHAGNPTQYFSNSDYPDGWRNNADTRLCDMGVNPARNFSRGFNDASANVFCSSGYRGFAPFSSSEANALRQFVENHTI